MNFVKFQEQFFYRTPLMAASEGKNSFLFFYNITYYQFHELTFKSIIPLLALKKKYQVFNNSPLEFIFFLAYSDDE